VNDMMKKLWIIGLLILNIFIVTTQKISAVTTQSVPYETYTIGPQGRRVLTQTAYEPAGYFNTEYTLNSPEDMYIKDDVVYIADTGNQRILKVDQQGNAIEIITGLNTPTGIHVDDDFNIYVADKGDKAIYKYNELGILINTFLRPDEAIFGTDSPFVPVKIATGPRDVLYVVGEGSTGGLIQLNYAGEFLSFFGTNDTETSWYKNVADFFGVEFAKNIPVSPTNVTLDESGSVFTVSNTTTQQLKKFNISSTIILEETTEQTLVSVVTNSFENIYTLSNEGVITEYDSYGNLIFEFGGLDQGNKILGLFVNPIDFSIDSNNNIYVLDKGTNKIQILEKSEFASMIHQGLIDFKNGIYSIEQWEEVLRMNSVFALANSSIARALYRDMDYRGALAYYLIAYDQGGYSEAFWQIRYDWLQNYLGIMLIMLLAGYIVVKSLKSVDKHYQIYEPVRKLKKQMDRYRIYRELKLSLSMFRHPIDTYYEIKHRQKSSYLTASLIFAGVVIVSIVGVYLTSFVFTRNDVTSFNFLRYTAIILGLIILFIFSNYLISTLNNGEGWFKDIYISTAYALIPYVLFTIPIVLLSNVMTQNEVFIYQALLFIRNGWSLLLIVIMIKEIHGYSLSELIKNILLTIFTMVMISLILFLIYVLFNQMIDYVVGIIREVLLR
jgi:hypothetical protein